MKFVLVLLVVMVTACGDALGPSPIGVLKARITEGKTLRLSAGIKPATPVVGNVYREAITANGSVSISAQANAFYCVGEDQKDLIPHSRCVLTDATGNSRVDWAQVPTKAGTYCARFNATFGMEATTLDTACVVIKAGAPDQNLQRDIMYRPSPSFLRTNYITDTYNNEIPYRIKGDAFLTPQDTVLGSLGARTVAFGGVDSTWRITSILGEGDVELAILRYRIVSRDNLPQLVGVLCGPTFRPCVSIDYEK
jgi:hypothetical protein